MTITLIPIYLLYIIQNIIIGHEVRVPMTRVGGRIRDLNRISISGVCHSIARRGGEIFEKNYKNRSGWDPFGFRSFQSELRTGKMELWKIPNHLHRPRCKRTREFILLYIYAYTRMCVCVCAYNQAHYNMHYDLF